MVVIEEEQYGQKWDVRNRSFFFPFVSTYVFYNLDAHLILCVAAKTGENRGLDQVLCLVPDVRKIRCI